MKYHRVIASLITLFSLIAPVAALARPVVSVAAFAYEAGGEPKEVETNTRLPVGVDVYITYTVAAKEGAGVVVTRVANIQSSSAGQSRSSSHQSSSVTDDKYKIGKEPLCRWTQVKIQKGGTHTVTIMVGTQEVYRLTLYGPEATAS